MNAPAPLIRTEEFADRAAIAALLADVFDADMSNEEMAGPGAEARLVDALRENGDLLLGLVAEVGGNVVGYVAFSRAFVDAESGPLPVSVLAPVGVARDFQRFGIATSLTEAGLRLMAQTGEKAVFVLGDPDYYCCFDFASEPARAFPSPWSAKAGDAHMVLELEPGALAGLSGPLRYAPAFAGMEAG